jgi:hypothetical protein
MELKRNTNPRVLLLGGAVALAAIVAVVVFVLGRDDAGAPPASWDPQVVELVEWVQQARGLAFVNPLRVDAVSDAGFGEAVGADAPAAADVDRAEGTVVLLRSLGLVTDRSDDRSLAEAAARLVLDGGDRARYLPAQARVVVRGDSIESLDWTERAALVEALGTALHDQHFGIAGSSRFDRSTASAGRRALAAGVGAALADRYVTEVLERELREWRLAQGRGSGQGAADLVRAMSLLSDDLGEPLVQVALNDAAPGEGPRWGLVNGLLAAPPRTELELLQPWAAIDGFERVGVPLPQPPDGEQVVASGDFGAASLYLVAALRVDAREALAAVLDWAGDAYLLTRDGEGRPCVTVVVSGTDGDASDRIEAVLRDWVRAGPRQADASVARDARNVTLRSCAAAAGADPGIVLDPATAVSVPVSRTDLLAELRADGRTRANAVCVADRVLAAIPVASLTDPDRPPEADTLYEILRRESDQACRRT